MALILVFLTKRSLGKTLSYLVHKLGGGQHGTIILWSIIFLPGTIIHELSHFFFAILTGARTGKIEILPEYLSEDFEDEGQKSVALGYVQTSQLNPLQGFFVGLAPFIAGSVLLVWFSLLINSSYQQANYPLLSLVLYLFFTVTNSFFPSWVDIKQTLTFIVLIIVVLLGFYFYQLPSLSINLPYQSLLNTLNQSLFLAALLNLILIILIKGIIYLWPKPKKSYHQSR